MKKFISAVMFLGPVVAFAQISGPISGTLNTVKGIIDFGIPLLLSAAVLVFFYGLVKYIMNASDEAAKEGGKNMMIGGMVALFVMVAFWGIIGYFQQSAGLSGSITTSSAPSVNFVPTT